jgi:hypothetical protein
MSVAPTTSFDLSWTPAGDLNSTAQQVQYAIAGSSDWVTVVTLSAIDNSYTVSGIDYNQMFDFRIVNICKYGGPIPSSTFQSINISCPTVDIVPAYDTVTFNFDELGGSVTSYQLDILSQEDGSTVTSQTVPTDNPVSVSFMGLVPTSGYYLVVTPQAGAFSNRCPGIPFSTTDPPPCNGPTDLTVSPETAGG